MTEEHPFAPLTPYAASKAAGDHLVLAYVATWGLDAATVRPFNNYGPRQNSGRYAGVVPVVIGQILRGETIVIDGDGNQTRDFIFVRDTADAAVRVYEEPEMRGKVLNIATGVPVTINELVEHTMKAVGRSTRIVHGPKRPGDVREHAADVSLASRVIGFKPTVGLAEGLQETAAWYRASEQVA